jgi:hypothetical protein
MRVKEPYTKALKVQLPEKPDESPDITLYEEPEYSDERFYADIRKASGRLDKMEQKALKEHARGKTRKFPV